MSYKLQITTADMHLIVIITTSFANFPSDKLHPIYFKTIKAIEKSDAKQVCYGMLKELGCKDVRIKFGPPKKQKKDISDAIKTFVPMAKAWNS